jgi:hypothetical protein
MTMDAVTTSRSSAAVQSEDTVPFPVGNTVKVPLVKARAYRNCGEKCLKGRDVFKVAWLPPQGAAATQSMIPVDLYFQMMDGKPTLLVDDVKSNTNVHTLPIEFLRAYGQLDGHLILETGRRCKGGPATHHYLVGKNEVASAMKKFVLDCERLKAHDDPCRIGRQNLFGTPVDHDVSICTLENLDAKQTDAEGFPAVLHLELVDNKPTLIVEDADSKKIVRTFPIEYLRGYGQEDGKLKLMAGRRCVGGPAVYRYNVGTSDVASAMRRFVAEWKEASAGLQEASTLDQCELAERLKRASVDSGFGSVVGSK